MPRARILVIDDDSQVATVIARALRDHDVAVVDSPTDALHALGARAFDVVVCDLEMPVMSGVDLLETARARGLVQRERFVFMTAFPASAEVRRAAAAGSHPIFPKPVDVGVLRAVVDQMATHDPEE